VREGMHNDWLDALGFLRHRERRLYASRDERESWIRIPRYLPYVTSAHPATID